MVKSPRGWGKLFRNLPGLNILAFALADGLTDGQTDMARSTRVVILVNNISFIWSETLPCKNNPFILRVTGLEIMIMIPKKKCLITLFKISFRFIFLETDLSSISLIATEK